MRNTEGLLASAREGDRSAVGALLGRHQGRLLAFLHARAQGMALGGAEPEDVLQETLILAVRRVREFEHQGPGSFYRWLVGIAKFKALEAQRAGRALKRAALGPLDADPVAQDTSPTGRIERSERAARVAEAIQTLPADQAEAVRLRYLEGCSVAETAERLARSEGAVKALVTRGLEGLSHRLQP